MRIARPCGRRLGLRMGVTEGEMESPPRSDWNQEWPTEGNHPIRGEATDGIPSDSHRSLWLLTHGS